VFWDSGSTLSFITNHKANELQLKGDPINLSLVTVGGKTTQLESHEYRLVIYDENGKGVEIQAIGIEKISSSIGYVDRHRISEIFRIDESIISRPTSGEIDLLIGLQYAAYHPAPVEIHGHLVLYSNRFGKVIGGSHPEIHEDTKLDDLCAKARVAISMHVTPTVVTRFMEMEGLGVMCNPRCGNCSCKTCHLGGKPMSLKDEEELRMIEEKLVINPKTGRWMIEEYPWIKDPRELSNNRKVAVAKLYSTEKRLLNNPEYKDVYSSQIQDMLDRKAAREITQSELDNYNGPQFYLAHHAVSKPDSKSTPVRIVFDCAARYMGLSLNDCLAKGPSLLNALLGILLRFRQNRVAFIGDIRKMYHSIDISIMDQMMHLFLWRNCETNQAINTYAITAVNMGDRPSAAIAQVALRKTAEASKDIYPESAGIVINNSYMDDISASVDNESEATLRMDEIDRILNPDGFVVKEWISNSADAESVTTAGSKPIQVTMGDDKSSATEAVLGLRWDVERDLLKFKFKALSEGPDIITKRVILSIANSIFDPIGLLTPFTVKVKIIMRSAWAHEPKLVWDSPLPSEIERKWLKLMDQIPLLAELTFRRSLTPPAAVGAPILVIFCDGSVHAYGAVAYIRWQLQNETYESRLIMARTRIAPLKTIDIVRIELCGAVLAARMRTTILKEINLQFDKIILLTDSEIVHAMIHRQSYGFNTFAANRIGEIQQSSNMEEWGWVPGKFNAADVVTRGSSPEEIQHGTEWQKGPDFLQQKEVNWPVKFEVNRELQTPELKGSSSNTKKDGLEQEFVGMAEAKLGDEDLADRIDMSRFSKWKLLLFVTARILKLYDKFRASNKNTPYEPNVNSQDLGLAEIFWMKKAQHTIDVKQFYKFKPEVENGVIMVGGRTERWMASTWNQQKFILLPNESHISWLIARYEHIKGGHLGVAASVSKVRSRYWIIGIRVMMKRIVRECRHCKEKLMALQGQVISPLPIERIKPSRAFCNVGVDYFGPFTIKGEVQIRVRGKSYGVIITCFSSRAVYVDLAHDLSTDGFLQVLRRFACVRGWPTKFYSDRGTQLVGASNELKEIVKNLSWDDIAKYGSSFNADWEFAPADGKWYNGATEALVKSVKRALNAAIGEHVLKFSELQTCMFEAAELVNERPIGAHPNSPEEGVYLCPNDLLLGKTSNKAPQGPFLERTSDRFRFDFLQKVTHAFWQRWMREVFPNLVVEPKWHTEQRNVKVGDVVLVQDANPVRGKWKMALVTKAIVSKDGRVRRVEITYNSPEGSRLTVERPIQKLIVIVPIDN